MDLFGWLSTSLNKYRKPRPGFRFECLQDGRWLCLICDRSVQDTQMGFHARTKHGWQSPEVHIYPATLTSVASSTLTLTDDSNESA